MLIFDVIYVRHQKSFNKEYQSKIIFWTEKISLCKSLTICCADDYIANKFGSFYSTQNEAIIIKIVLENLQGLTRRTKKNQSMSILYQISKGYENI